LAAALVVALELGQLSTAFLGGGAATARRGAVSGNGASATGPPSLRRSASWPEEARDNSQEAPSFAGWRWAGILAALSAMCVAFAAAPGDTPGQGWQLRPQAAWAARFVSNDGNKINRDPNSLLQNALPLEEIYGEDTVKRIRTVQLDMELARSAKGSWDKAQAYVDDATRLMSEPEREALLKPVVAERQPQAKEIATKLQAQIAQMQPLINARDNDAFVALTTKATLLIGEVEDLFVPPGYASPVPADKAKGLPQLKGRATVELTWKRPKGSTEKVYNIDAQLYKRAKLKMVIDGYSAPLTAGNFIDLVDKGFYDGKPLQRADGFICQLGDPNPKGKADEHGYKGPDGKIRRIPLEIAVKGKKQAFYSETLEEANAENFLVKLPFQADGLLSMAREEFDNDSNSSQFFIFVFDSDMTPAGKNFLDGRYSTFGYTVENQEFIRQLREGDILVSAKVLDGMDKLVRPEA